MTVLTDLHDPETLIGTQPTPELQAIAKKVVEGQRLTPEDGLTLFETEHDNAVADLADYARQVRVGDTVFYASTLYIHPTNLCELSCPMCSFYAKPGWDSAWFLTPQQIEEKVRRYHNEDLTEIHVVGGLWRECDMPYYQEMFTRIHEVDPKLHIKALTAVEYDFLAKHHNISIEEVFTRMMSWGLGSLPGGGAEVLVEKIRKQVAPQKITSDQFLDIHRRAHLLGLRSNITMLYGHVEDVEHLVAHMCRVRELQDETGGFQNFVPLTYHEENNALGKRKKRLKPKDPKRVHAVSRLMLDNIPNIKVLWNYLGVDLALDILQAGGNDLSSTNVEEKIIVMAGGMKVRMTPEKMDSLIHSIGREPKRIHSGYDTSQDQL